MKKIWISGVKGQIGKALLEVIDALEYEILDTDIEDVDITDLEAALVFGEMNRPDIIINCSGIVNEKYCEENEKEAYIVNAFGARNLSIVAKKLEAKLVQMSTDDVFDGKSNISYKEFDRPNPISVYGKSKLAGEEYVKEFNNKHFIIRSSWVYGIGDNFVFDFIKRANENKEVHIQGNEYGSPTSALELAKFILYLINTSEYGTYHATNRGKCSRMELAKEIVKLTNIDVNLIEETGKDHSHVVLDNFVIGLMGNYVFPEWKESLAEYIEEQGELVNEYK